MNTSGSFLVAALGDLEMLPDYRRLCHDANAQSWRKSGAQTECVDNGAVQTVVQVPKSGAQTRALSNRRLSA